MELKEFIEKFAALFEETDANEISATIPFKQLNEWSSLMALSFIAMADEEWSVKIKGNDIRNSETIEDLYNTVKSKL